MQRLEIVIKFFLALASTAFLLIGGARVARCGGSLDTLRSAAGAFLRSQVRHRLRWGSSFRRFDYLLCVCLWEAIAFVYSIFAVMTGLLFWLLGRLRSIELLVTGVAAAMLSVAAGLLLYFYGSWGAMTQDFRGSIIDNLTTAVP